MKLTSGLAVLIMLAGCGSEKAPGSPVGTVVPEIVNPMETVPSGPVRAESQPDAAPPPSEVAPLDLPPVPAHPGSPTPLNVSGFRPASHVGPADDSGWPKPVVIVLHGNFDRPEWECDVWSEVAGFYGWTLCPRGVRTPWASKVEDRWTYNGARAVGREIEASLQALEERYPGRVTREGMVLAGFSLGGILAPDLALADPGKYEFLFLVEGGVKKLDKKKIKSLSKVGLKGVGLAMSAPGRRKLAVDAVKRLEARGLRAVFVDMKGSGHAYSSDFAVTGMFGLKKLIESRVVDAGPIE